MGKEIVVIKMNVAGEETWRYRGQLLERKPDRIVLEAYFDRQDMNLEGLFLGKGDRFVESYFAGCGFNIFEIHAREDDHIRGWYCNITRPPVFEGPLIRYVDLALDLLVFPDGRQIVLDEDEFLELKITAEELAIQDLRARFAPLTLDSP